MGLNGSRELQTPSTQQHDRLMRLRRRQDDRCTGQAVPHANIDSELYRSRSTRSFADGTVSAFRRTLRRIREWLMQKAQPKVEVFELSSMASSTEVNSKIIFMIIYAP